MRTDFIQCMFSIICYLNISVVLKVVNRVIYDRNYLTVKNNSTFIFHHHILFWVLSLQNFKKMKP